MKQNWKDESGAGTVFGLYMFVTLAMVLGLSLDFTNAWRNRTYLTSVADIAAHAGAVAMANGQSQAATVAAVQTAVTDNLPASLWGQVLDTSTDVKFAAFDIANKTFTGLSTGNDNSVVVKVSRTAARGNPVATFLLRFLGMDTLDVGAISASVYDFNGICDNTDGIYARGQVTLTSQTDVGSGFCIHSEDFVWLPQQNTFHQGSIVTMPDLVDCKNKCTVSANPGIVAHEAHMVMGDFGARILNTYNIFDAPMGGFGPKYEFFHDDPSDPNDPVITLGNTTALQSLLGISPPSLGDVIVMSQAQITALPSLPSGLVYKVNCAPNGSGVKTRIVFSGSAAKMDGSVLLTNCSLQFDSGSSIRSSVIITTRISSNAVVGADSHVTIGDPTLSCGSTERSHIMSMSRVTVPAEFVMSNVTLTVDDEVNIASATSSGATSYGFSVYATGQVHVAAQHTFRSCGTPGDWLTPEPKIIRLVVPPVI